MQKKILTYGDPAAEKLRESLKWIFFDVGSTFVSEKECHRERYIYFRDYLDEKAGHPVSYEEFEEVMYEGVRKGFNPVPYFKHYYRIKEPIPTYRMDLEKVFPEVPGALERLSGKYRLGVIANQRPGLPERLESYGLLKYLVPEAVFGSQDVGTEKPDPEIFRAALAAAGCRPEEALMVGDHAINDVKAAGALGIKTCRLYREYFSAYEPKDESETEDLSVENLAELADILC
ncbi:MAG: HAD family hydrolase [Clostridia bacterium]|nr:HAD family hydrolase [Clostridia bacterium]